MVKEAGETGAILKDGEDEANRVQKSLSGTGNDGM